MFFFFFGSEGKLCGSAQFQPVVVKSRFQFRGAELKIILKIT